MRLESKALVIGKMQVQHIQFEPGHPFNDPLKERDRQEPSGRIEHQAAPGKTRPIFDATATDTIGCGELRKGSEAMQRTPDGVRLDDHAEGTCFQCVAFIQANLRYA